MEKYYFTRPPLTALADAVREKTGSTAPLTVADMARKIGELPSLKNCAVGSFTLQEDSTLAGVRISHSLNKIPFFVAVFAESDELWDKRDEGYYWYALSKTNLGEEYSEEAGRTVPCATVINGAYTYSKNNVRTRTALDGDYGDSADSFGLPYYQNYFYRAGVKYTWICAAKPQEEENDGKC